MATIIEAVYDDGVLVPLEQADLKAQQRYRLTVEEITADATATTERERLRDALRAAGLLTELGPNLREQADASISLEEVRAALGGAGGPALSDIILEDRGPRE